MHRDRPCQPGVCRCPWGSRWRRCAAAGHSQVECCGLPACHTSKIFPAVPSPNGPDVFEHSACSDGTYVRAFTSEGILRWRRKIGSTTSGPVPSRETACPTGLHKHPCPLYLRLNLCRQKRDAVRDRLKARHLSAAAGSSESLWTVEEEGAQCKLWFADSQVTRKRKTLTTE